MKKTLYVIFLLSSGAALTGCANDNAQDSDDPIVGLWKADYPPNGDGGYEATWRFNSDGSYDHDFSSGSISGGAEGYSIGTYDLISDSILVVHSTEHENLRSNYAFGKEEYTLLVEITDSTLTSTAVRLVGDHQYKNAGTTIEWEMH